MARTGRRKPKPMNADNPSKVTKIGKNKTLIEPADEGSDFDVLNFFG